MDYNIIGNNMPAVEVTLHNGESMFTQSGAMAWMTEGITMSTNLQGGIKSGIGRMFTGESLFMATYASTTNNAVIAFASTVPGEIAAISLETGREFVCQKGSFLCAQPTVHLKAIFKKKLSAGLFGGEGFILQEISGSGMVFLEIDGDKVEKTLAPGEVIKVDTGNVVAFEKTVRYEVETVKGFKNIFLGGEGLFLTKLTGPGKVILQTQNFNDFAGRINALLPSK